MKNMTVYQVAESLGVTHTTVYNKLNDKHIYKELKPFIVKDGRQRLVRPEGIEVLKNHINIKVKSEETLETEFKDTPKENVENLERDILNDIIKTLQEQIKVKDKQIEGLENALHQNQLLFLNSQKLLESQQQKQRRTLLQWLGLKN